jgi:hypothetical protein
MDHADYLARMSRIKIRPLTVLLFVGAIALAAVGVLYLTDTAAHLPSFFPGHAAGSTKHHYKHGLAALTLAILALGVAWFTTAPDQPTA